MGDTYDSFSWIVEGILLALVGILGIFGNSFSLLLFSRQKVHKIFHNLLLLLSVFDMVYVLSSILIFCAPKFSQVYNRTYRIYMLPWILPTAHIGLMGSVYSTVAITIERYLAVCYPFLHYRRVYSSRSFILPAIVFTALYNIPKFFELTIKMESCSNSTGISTRYCNDGSLVYYKINPTPMRLNYVYIRVYILWMNLIVQILIPFLVLIVLNVRIYKQVRLFEKTITENIRVSFSSKRGSNVSRGEESGKSFSFNSELMEFSAKNFAKRDSNQNPVASRRRREVLLAKISLYITFVFLFCHMVRLIPNTYEVLSTYIKIDKNLHWSMWIGKVVNVSHLLLAFASSANFFIYYIKYGQNLQQKP